MNYTNTAKLAVAAAALSLTACKKSNYEGGNTTILIDNTVAILKELQGSSTALSVTAGIPQEIVGPQGTFLRFYPNSFRDNNGNVITSGNVSIELTEMYKAGDMLKYYTSTTTSAAVLTSGGQVFIKATIGGNEVKVNKYGIGFPTNLTPGTGPRELFFGNTYAKDGMVTWGGSDGVLGTKVLGPGSVSTSSVVLTAGDYYMFDSCTSFNWVGCHHPYSGTGQNITVKVKLANMSFAGNVWSTAFMGLSAQRVATTMYQESFDRETQTLTYKGLAPTGVTQKFMILVPYDKNNWYYYKTEQPITDGMTIEATMTKNSKDEMAATLTAF